MDRFSQDLKRCGIRTVMEEGAVVGVPRIPGGFSVRIVSGRSYFVVRIYPGLPADAAEVISSRRHIENGTGNSTHDGRLGGLARAHGFAGGLFGDDLRRYGCGHVDMWHVDAIGALDALMAALRMVISVLHLTADAARRSLCVAHTERWIRDCEHVMRSGGKAGEMIRENLHLDDTLDASDPRIIALREEFPSTTAVQP